MVERNFISTQITNMNKQVKVIIGTSLQKEFTEGVYSSEENKNLVPEIVKYFNEQDPSTTIFIMLADAHYENYEHTLEAKFNSIKHCIKGSDMAEIIPEVLNCMENKEHAITINKSALAADLLPVVMMQTITESRYNLAREEPPVIKEVEFVGFNFSKDIFVNMALLRSYYPNMNLVVNTSLCNDNDKEALENTIKVLPNMLVTTK